MYVKPAPLRPELRALFAEGEAPACMRVRDHRLKDFIPDEGRDVPDGDTSFVRHLAAGDLVLAQPPAPEPAEAAAS